MSGGITADGMTTRVACGPGPGAGLEPYRDRALDALAKELEPLIEKIVADAIAR